MSVLQPSEYDASYFNGRECVYAHNAGYANYDRMKPSLEKKAKELFDRFDLFGKMVLELGCAKGYVIKALRDMEVLAIGADISEYAISCADEEISSYLTVMDALRYCLGSDSLDFIFSLQLLDSLTDIELQTLIPEMNRVAWQQYHLINVMPNKRFFPQRPMEWWKELPWKPGTILVEIHKTNKEIVI